MERNISRDEMVGIVVSIIALLVFLFTNPFHFNKNKQSNPTQTAETTPKTATGWYQKGNISYHSEAYEEAIKYYDKALSLDPNDANAWRKKGDCFQKLKIKTQATECYNKCLKINPNDVEALLSIGITHAKTGNHNEAIEYYDQALAIDPNDARLYNAKGSSLMNLDNPREAERIYDQALALDINYANAWLGKALIHYWGFDCAGAKEFVNKAVECDPNWQKAKDAKKRIEWSCDTNTLCTWCKPAFKKYIRETN